MLRSRESNVFFTDSYLGWCLEVISGYFPKTRKHPYFDPDTEFIWSFGVGPGLCLSIIMVDSFEARHKKELSLFLVSEYGMAPPPEL